MDEFVSECKMRGGEHSVKAHRFVGSHGGEGCCTITLALVTQADNLESESLGQHPWCLGFEWGSQVDLKASNQSQVFWHCDRMLAINSSREERGDLGSHF